MGLALNNCRQIIRASLLGAVGKRIACPRGLVVGLPVAPGGDYLAWCRRLLAQRGLRDTEELKSLPGLPPGAWICRDIPQQGPPVEESPADPLLHAAILGLCNPVFYSPRRPVIWTESRLRRRVELFAIGDIYAD